MPLGKQPKPSRRTQRQQRKTEENKGPEVEVVIEPPVYGELSYRCGQPTADTHPHLLRENELLPGIHRQEFEERRERLFNRVQADSAIFLPCAEKAFMSLDAPHPYRQDANFLYFTGLQESGCLAVLTKDDEGKCEYYLFVQARDASQVTWNGHCCGVEGAKKVFGANFAYLYDKGQEKLGEIMDTHSHLYLDKLVNTKMTDSIEFIREQSNRKRSFRPSRRMLEEERVRKTPTEIHLMEACGLITGLGFVEMMQACQPGMIESELVSRFEFSVKGRGADRLSFLPACGSGENATILHYFNNDCVMEDGELVLVDCGPEFCGYSADCTRTFPVNGKFSHEQRLVYDLTLRISNELISMCKRGGSIQMLDRRSTKMLKNGLHELGIRVSENQIKQYKLCSSAVHYVAHHIGMDIHDCNEIPMETKFEPGMCLAVEPGIYLPDCPIIPPQFRNIGVRIEDDVVVTEGEPILLTRHAPRDPDHIERIMSESVTPVEMISRLTINNIGSVLDDPRQRRSYRDEKEREPDASQEADPDILNAAAVLFSFKGGPQVPQQIAPSPKVKTEKQEEKREENGIGNGSTGGGTKGRKTKEKEAERTVIVLEDSSSGDNEQATEMTNTKKDLKKKQQIDACNGAVAQHQSSRRVSSIASEAKSAEERGMDSEDEIISTKKKKKGSTRTPPRTSRSRSSNEDVASGDGDDRDEDGDVNMNGVERGTRGMGRGRNQTRSARSSKRKRDDHDGNGSASEKEARSSKRSRLENGAKSSKNKQRSTDSGVVLEIPKKPANHREPRVVTVAGKNMKSSSKQPSRQAVRRSVQPLSSSSSRINAMPPPPNHGRYRNDRLDANHHRQASKRIAVSNGSSSYSNSPQSRSSSLKRSLDEVSSSNPHSSGSPSKKQKKSHPSHGTFYRNAVTRPTHSSTESSRSSSRNSQSSHHDSSSRRDLSSREDSRLGDESSRRSSRSSPIWQTTTTAEPLQSRDIARDVSRDGGGSSQYSSSSSSSQYYVEEFGRPRVPAPPMPHYSRYTPTTSQFTIRAPVPLRPQIHNRRDYSYDDRSSRVNYGSYRYDQPR